jgi:hypothetical protein
LTLLLQVVAMGFSAKLWGGQSERLLHQLKNRHR